MYDLRMSTVDFAQRGFRYPYTSPVFVTGRGMERGLVEVEGDSGLDRACTVNACCLLMSYKIKLLHIAAPVKGTQQTLTV